MGNDIANFLTTSSHPAVTGSTYLGAGTIVTQSFFDPPTGFESSSYCIVNGTASANCEYVFMDQPAVGIKNRVSDKIKLQELTLASGSVLSPYRSMQQDCYNSQSYTCNVNVLEVTLSPTNQINDDIIGRFGHFNIGDWIGDPRSINAAGARYGDLNKLSERYFENYNKPYQYKDFINLIRFFDNSVFKTIKDFTPAKLNPAVGILIKQHLLERNKYNQPSVTSSMEQYTGSVVNLPRDYMTGSIQVFSGGTGGTFEIYNGMQSSPSASAFGLTQSSALVDFTQSWNETTNYISGNIQREVYNQDEFYDGEFSGSLITVTTGDLNVEWRNIEYSASTSFAGGEMTESMTMAIYSDAPMSAGTPLGGVGVSETVFDAMQYVPTNTIAAFCGSTGFTKFKYDSSNTTVNNFLGQDVSAIHFDPQHCDFTVTATTPCTIGSTLESTTLTVTAGTLTGISSSQGLTQQNSSISASIGDICRTSIKFPRGLAAGSCVRMGFEEYTGSYFSGSEDVGSAAYTCVSDRFYPTVTNHLQKYAISASIKIGGTSESTISDGEVCADWDGTDCQIETIGASATNTIVGCNTCADCGVASLWSSNFYCNTGHKTGITSTAACYDLCARIWNAGLTDCCTTVAIPFEFKYYENDVLVNTVCCSSTGTGCGDMNYEFTNALTLGVDSFAYCLTVTNDDGSIPGAAIGDKICMCDGSSNCFFCLEQTPDSSTVTPTICASGSLTLMHNNSNTLDPSETGSTITNFSTDCLLGTSSPSADEHTIRTDYNFSASGYLKDTDCIYLQIENYVIPSSTSCLNFASASLHISPYRYNGTANWSNNATCAIFISKSINPNNNPDAAYICTLASAPASQSIILEGYGTSSQIPLLNNISSSRTNSDYVYVLNTSSKANAASDNQTSVIRYESASAIPITTPKSYYTSKANISTRYIGNQVSQAVLNEWAFGDIGTLGEVPSIQQLGTYVGFFNEVKTTTPILNNHVSTKLLYLIDDMGNAITPNLNSSSFYNVIDNFTEGKKACVDLSTQSDRELNIINGEQQIIKGGCYPVPITRTQGSYLEGNCGTLTNCIGGTYFNTTMSFGGLDVSTGVGGGITNFQKGFSTLTGGAGCVVDGVTACMEVDDTLSNSNIALSSGCFAMQVAGDGITLSATGCIGFYMHGGVPYEDNILIKAICNGVTKATCYNYVEALAGSQFNLGFSNLSWGNTLAISDVISICVDLACTNTALEYCTNASGTPSFINITQYPNPSAEGGCGVNSPFWALKDGINPSYTITSSDTLGDFYDNDNYQVGANSGSKCVSSTICMQENISGSYFDRIQDQFFIQRGDEFRWGNNEDTKALVVNACKVGSYISVEFDQQIDTGIVDLDSFVHRRYKQDASYIILKQPIPSASFDGSGIIFPQYATEDIGGKTADEVIEILAEKNLITKTN